MSRFDAWDVGPPPRQIADGVMERVEREERRLRGRRALAAGAMAAVACAASVLATVWSAAPPSLGDVVATERMEIEVAPGVLAVMEQASHLVWRGREILQDRGEVSYRVKAGAALELSTPTARVEGGASSSRVLVDPASTYVVVRDGEISFAKGDSRVSLGAGRYARADHTSMKTDRDDVDGSIGRFLGVVYRGPDVEPASPPGPVTTSAAPTPKATLPVVRGGRPVASVSAAPSASAPPPPPKHPIVPPCFCNPIQAVCDCGGG